MPTKIRVRAKEDIKSPTNGRVMAKAGREGLVVFSFDVKKIRKGKAGWRISVLWDGRKTNCHFSQVHQLEILEPELTPLQCHKKALKKIKKLKKKTERLAEDKGYVTPAAAIHLQLALNDFQKALDLTEEIMEEQIGLEFQGAITGGHIE